MEVKPILRPTSADGLVIRHNVRGHLDHDFSKIKLMKNIVLIAAAVNSCSFEMPYMRFCRHRYTVTNLTSLFGKGQCNEYFLVLTVCLFTFVTTRLIRTRA